MFVDVAVAVALGGLLIATILYEVGYRPRLVKVLFRAGFVPQWSFFAPTPGTQDLYLLYRDVFGEDEVTAWKVVHEMDAPRGPWTFIWNPRRRLRKALHDLVLGVELSRQNVRPDVLKLSDAYVLLIHHISTLPRLYDATATEFLIMASDPEQPPKASFMSERHKLWDCDDLRRV